MNTKDISYYLSIRSRDVCQTGLFLIEHSECGFYFLYVYINLMCSVIAIYNLFCTLGSADDSSLQ